MAKVLKATAEKNKFRGAFKLSRWSSTHTKAADFSGWEVRNYRNEAELVKEIVIDILTKLDYNALFITEFPVGLESRLHEVIRILREDFNELARNVVVYCGGLFKSLVLI